MQLPGLTIERRLSTIRGGWIALRLKAITIELIFTWPGLGSLAVTGVTERDYPLVLATVMVGGAMVILGNLLADVLYAFVDPRITY